MSPIEKLLERIVLARGPLASQCWLWQGACTNRGYGNMRVSGRTVATHRFAYMALRGPIPDGLQLDHLCRQRSCCNPDHLEPVTQAVNLERGVGPYGTHTHCANGHELVPPNLRRISRPGRACLACHNQRNRDAYRARVGITGRDDR